MIHGLINTLCWILALYVVLESIEPLADMAGGMHCFCHKIKYLAAISAGLWIGYLGWVDKAHLVHIVFISTLSLFIWPRTVYRIKELYEFERDFESMWNV